MHRSTLFLALALLAGSAAGGASDELAPSLRARIQGAVKRPGDYPLKEGARILDLISRAEGFRETVGKTMTHTCGICGRERVISLRMLLKGDQASNVALAQGDAVLVPEGQRRSPYFERRHRLIVDYWETGVPGLTR
jgi:hypothetical protein